MANTAKKSISTLFDDAGKSASAVARLLNPSANGAGSRVFPARNTKNDAKYGIRIDKGEPLHGQPDMIKLKMQVNSNADSPALRNLAKQDPHRVISTAIVDTKKEPTKENLDDLEAQFKANLKI